MLSPWTCLLTLFLFQIGTISSTVVMDSFFKKPFQISWPISPCLLQSTYLANPTVFYCSMLCSGKSQCEFFCIDDHQCELYKALISIARSLPASNSSKNCYTSWGHPRDVAHLAVVDAADYYSPVTRPPNAIAGFFCRGYAQCYVSKHNTNRWWRADLKDIYPISRIQVRTSREYNFFKDVEFRVGNSTTLSSNPVVFENPGQAPLDHVVGVNLDPPVSGRYVTLQSKSTGYFFVCDIQIIRAQ
ncbi:uncharacterized protein LOC143039213 [Oratosquilla oratoria]|uniref:uncharacterized protein LOC143039213 n=1 Tax=Oratosquilla oratoria TaxID=337810 RepID=UPI003F76C9FA